MANVAISWYNVWSSCPVADTKQGIKTLIHINNIGKRMFGTQ